MSLTLSLLLACLRPALPPPEAPAPGLIGVRLQAIPEGLVVVDVVPDSGAARAGLAVGDRILAVEDLSLDSLNADADAARLGRQRLQGPPGTSVDVVLAGPLGAPTRQVKITRGVVPPRDREAAPPVVAAFRRALLGGSPRAAARASRALVEASFGGLSPVEAVARPLRVTATRRPAVAAAAARALISADTQDAGLLLLAGEALFRAEQWSEAADVLSRAEATRAADLIQFADGATAGAAWGDVGGDPLGRRLLAEALWYAGRRDEAVAVGRALLSTHDIPALAGTLGMAPMGEGEAWRAALPPPPAIETTLLDGAAWSLAEQRGQVVLLTFWASWCEPCQAELPHLQELYARHRDEGLVVIGVSVDDQGAGEQAAKMARRLGLTFPVAHAPEVGDRYEVSSIPSLRLIGRDGSVSYATRGYSPAAMGTLSRKIGEALALSGDAGAELARVWSAGQASLTDFLPQGGARGLTVSDAGLTVGVRGATPLTVLPTEDGRFPALEADVAQGAESERVAWLGGPVAVDTGRLVLRAWDPDGASRWMVTTPGPVADLASSEGSLWVAAGDEVLQLDAGGALLRRLPVAARALAAAPGGVWAVDGTRRWWLPSAGDAEDRGAAPDGAVVAADGSVATRTAVDLVVGRFGPDGAPRPVVARSDGRVIGLDGEGGAALQLSLPANARLAAWDPDGDGQDALVLSVADHGVAVVSLRLP